MNSESVIKKEVSDKQSIEEILQSLSEAKANGCLQISAGSIEYFCYLDKGKLIYSTNSLSPFERLQRNLHRISHTNKTLTSKIIEEGINQFGQHLHDSSGIPIDYQVIHWLYKQNHISSEEASLLCTRVSYEVCESLLSLTGEFYSYFVNNYYQIPQFCRYNLSSFIYSCQQRIQSWQAFNLHINSSYQRPCFLVESSGIQNLALPENPTIFRLLKGLSFRQLAALVDKDEILLAKILYPSIVNKSIIVKDPKPPFNQLPKIPNYNIKIQTKEADSSNLRTDKSPQENNSNIIHKSWKIACIGESTTTQQQINYFLDKNTFSIFSIDDPTMALMKLIDLEPDLILLDVNLTEINGYELCSLLKSQPQFKTIPIIILNYQKGIIHRTKAKLAGSDNYIIKPFNRSDLLTMIIKYIDGN